jgi:hypothetical protein
MRKFNPPVWPLDLVRCAGCFDDNALLSIGQTSITEPGQGSLDDPWLELHPCGVAVLVQQYRHAESAEGQGDTSGADYLPGDSELWLFSDNPAVSQSVQSLHCGPRGRAVALKPALGQVKKKRLGGSQLTRCISISDRYDLA